MSEREEAVTRKTEVLARIAAETVLTLEARQPGCAATNNIALQQLIRCAINESYREAIEAAARWHDREADILDRSFKQMRAEGFPVDNENAARHRRYAQAIRALGEKADDTPNT